MGEEYEEVDNFYYSVCLSLTVMPCTLFESIGNESGIQYMRQ